MRLVMKQVKGIIFGFGVYFCIVVFNKFIGKILVVRDRLCVVGKCGFCKYIVVFCYKLVELKMLFVKKFFQFFSCIEIR